MPFARACRPIALQMRLPRLHKRHSTVRLQATAIPHEGLVEAQKFGIRLRAQVEILPGRSTFAQIMTFRAATRAVQRPGQRTENRRLIISGVHGSPEAWAADVVQDFCSAWAVVSVPT